MKFIEKDYHYGFGKSQDDDIRWEMIDVNPIGSTAKKTPTLDRFPVDGMLLYC